MSGFCWAMAPARNAAVPGMCWAAVRSFANTSRNIASVNTPVATVSMRRLMVASEGNRGGRNFVVFQLRTSQAQWIDRSCSAAHSIVAPNHKYIATMRTTSQRNSRIRSSVIDRCRIAFEHELTLAKSQARRSSARLGAVEGSYAASVDQIGGRVMRTVEEYLNAIDDSRLTSGTLPDAALPEFRRTAAALIAAWPRSLR